MVTFVAKTFGARCEHVAVFYHESHYRRGKSSDLCLDSDSRFNWDDQRCVSGMWLG